jgi:hypothetical protein
MCPSEGGFRVGRQDHDFGARVEPLLPEPFFEGLARGAIRSQAQKSLMHPIVDNDEELHVPRLPALAYGTPSFRNTPEPSSEFRHSGSVLMSIGHPTLHIVADRLQLFKQLRR